jgi:hypothetical protein
MIVDDSFLSVQQIKDIQDRVIKHGLDIPWTLAYNTDVDNGKESVDGAGVYHSYQFAAGLVPQMPSYNYFMNVFQAFTLKHNISYNEIIRVKLNWLPRNADGNPDSWHMPHVDADTEHQVFLYYLNDSDGDTFFFNEKYPLAKGSELTLSKRVEPAAGKGVIFDGLTYHASSSPIKSNYRCILNVDFK